LPNNYPTSQKETFHAETVIDARGEHVPPASQVQIECSSHAASPEAPNQRLPLSRLVADGRFDFGD